MPVGVVDVAVYRSQTRQCHPRFACEHPSSSRAEATFCQFGGQDARSQPMPSDPECVVGSRIARPASSEIVTPKGCKPVGGRHRAEQVAGDQRDYWGHVAPT
jgi:hypothetical protein